jgi:hypothetical protein
MAWKTKTYELESDGPLLMHNGQLADPVNRFTKQLKEISGKRKKVDADFEQMAKIEFLGSLYTKGKDLVLPADMLNACLINSAKVEKMGKAAKAGVIVRSDMVFDYGENKPFEELFEDENYKFVKAVRVQQNKVMRTRPKFDSWTGKVEVQYEDSLVNEASLDRWFVIAGTQIGLGDWRPVYGRFKVKGA